MEYWDMFWTVCIYGWLAIAIFGGLFYVADQIGQRMDKGL